MTTILPSKTGNILLASYKTGNPFEIYAGTVIIAHSGVAIYGNASQVFTLSNAGNVYGYNDGIALNLGGTITNTGTISSNFTALNIAGGAGYVVNSGSLIGRTTDAVAMTDGGTLINKLGGNITGAFLGSSGSDAVFITGAVGTVVNYGAITQSAKAGQIRNGVLLNAGGALTNHATGTITAGTFGVEARNAVGTVVNSGSIGGALVGVALYDGGGVTNQGGAITGAAGVYVTGAAGTIVNGYTITGSVGAGVYLKAGGRVSNLGTGAKISGAGNGVAIAGGSGTVQNSGSISGSFGGVVLSGGGYVNNVGAASKLNGGAVGVGVRGGTGTVSNAATITATGTAGVGVEFYDSIGTVSNSGWISGALAGVVMNKGGALSNLSGASAISGGAGVYATGAAATIVNGATLTGTVGAGVYLKAGGRVTNLGTGATINGGGDGVQIAGAAGTVQNSGTIKGVIGGVVLSGGGYVNNIGAARVITGGTLGVYGRGGTTTVVNYATLTATGTAGVGVEFTDNVGQFANTVINSGTIGGASGKAVQFAGGNDLLVIDPGAVFTGAVDGGAGTNTLEFGKGAVAGGFTGLGSSAFANFQIVKVNAGATWTFTGTNVLGSGATLTNSGALTLAGTSIFTGPATNYGVISGTMTIISPGTAGPLVNEAGATITSAGEAIYGAFKAWSLTNAGTIAGALDGVHLVSAGGSITNQGAGLISGATGVLLAAGGEVTNSATIQGVTVVGVYAGAALTLDNHASGTIVGYFDGVVCAGGYAILTNEGTIDTTGAGAVKYGGPEAAVSLADGAVTNSGLVESTLGLEAVVLGAGVVSNLSGGVIAGPSGGVSGAETVLNWGVITETSALPALARPTGGFVRPSSSLGSGGIYGVDLREGGALTNYAGASIFNDQVGVGMSTAGTLVNFGEIYGGHYGVISGAGSQIINEAGATITDDAFVGVFMVASTLTNAGRIVGYERIDRGQVINQASGLMGEAEFRTGSGTVMNAGTISGANYGVSFSWYQGPGTYTYTGSGTVQNTGLIQGTTKAADGIFFLAPFSNTVINAGTIIGGAAGEAIQFAGGNDLLVDDPGAVFKAGVASSVVDGGGGSDTIELATGPISGHFAGLGSAFTSFETVIVDAGASWIFSGLNTVGPGVVLDVFGTLTNSGTLSGTPTLIAAGEVVNNVASTIVDIGDAVLGLAGAVGSVINRGTISGQIGSGVYLQAGGHVQNIGAGASITGGYDGVFIEGGEGTLTNSGLIEGYGALSAFAGVALVAGGALTNQVGGRVIGANAGVAAGDSASIINYGTITGQTSFGVTFAAGGRLSNFGAGSLSGATGGVDIEGGAGTVTNSATIAAIVAGAGTIDPSGDNAVIGIKLGSGGKITNSTAGGLIAGYHIGVFVNGAAGTVDNYGGTIEASGTHVSYATPTIIGVGVELLGGGTVYNSSGALIMGLRYGVLIEGVVSSVLNAGVIKATGGNGVGASASAVVNKAGGTISGGIGVETHTLTNAGTITGGEGVSLRSGGTVENYADGVISGAFSVGVFAYSGIGTVTNWGTITSAQEAALRLKAGGTIDNLGAAALLKGYDGVYASGAAVTITNSGTIESMGAIGEGLDLAAGASVVNGGPSAVSATIEGFKGVYARTGGAVTVTNYGLIEGAGGLAVQFLNSADRLVVETGATFVGTIAGGGGALELAEAGGALSGLGASGQLSGPVAATFGGFGTYQLDTGTWVVGSGATLSVSQGLILENGATAQVSGALSNSGAMALVSTTGRTDLRVLAAGATLSGGGTVTMSGPKSRIWGTATSATLTNVDNTISGSGWLGLSEMTLVNQAKGVIEAVGKQGLVVNTKGVTSTNAGIIESGAGSILTVQNSTFSQTGGGTIAALTGGRTLLSDDVIIGGTLSQAGTGVFNVNASGGELQAVALTGAIRVLRGVTLTLDGAIANAGKLNALGGSTVSKLIVGPDGVSLTGGGQVNLSASLNNIIVGAAAGDVLTNVDNRIAGAGDIGDGSMVLINKGQIVGSTAVTLTLDTGASTITNSGTISSVSTGQVVVKSALTNTGLIFAAAGTLTLDGAVTGAGAAQIKKGVLNIASTFGETVTFVSGATGQLRLTDWKDFTGSVKGLSLTGTNTIDLRGFTKTGATASYSGTTASGVLTVTNGTQTAKIHLTGDYTASTFTVANDGNGGVIVKEPSAPSGGALSAAPLIAATAGFGASQSADAALTRIPQLQPPVLARPA